MFEFLSIFIIGIALSMDTFSLSLGIGTTNLSNKKSLSLAITVGLMHFFMPLFGIFLGNKIISIFKINNNFLLGLILVAISLEMFFSIVKKEEKSFNLSVIGIILFSFGVSLDSFSTGIGLEAITQNIYLAMIVFSICSFCFTYMGLLIGKYSTKYLGIYSRLIGAILLLVIGFINIFNH